MDIEIRLTSFPFSPAGYIHKDNDKWRMFGGGERIGSSSPDILHAADSSFPELTCD